MTFVLQLAVLAAALVFVGVSAIMNALFLSSLGRTGIEIGLLAAVSVAFDVTKAALPVLLARAVMLRAWGYVAAISLLLVLVVAVSLASGAGFSATTRGAVTAGREARADQIDVRRKLLRELEEQLGGVKDARATAIIEAELKRLAVEYRSANSQPCTPPVATTHRGYCKDVHRLEVELATARVRDNIYTDRRSTLSYIGELQASGETMEIDPQARALAELTGIDQKRLRVLLTLLIAVLLELGSAVLVLLAAGPMLRGWQDPSVQQEPERMLATPPVQADRIHWHRQRGKEPVGVIKRGGCDAEQ